jgi:hypothetical protein
MRCCRHPEDETLYLEWARARELLAQCQQDYADCVARSNSPDIKLRALVED